MWKKPIAVYNLKMSISDEYTDAKTNEWLSLCKSTFL